MSAGQWVFWSLPLGVALDLAIGDPPGWPHPVRVIGRLIGFMERRLRQAAGTRLWQEYAAGVGLALIVTTTTGAVVWTLVTGAKALGGVVPLVLESLLIFWGLAIRSLGDEALRASDGPDLEKARVALSSIVGRDVSGLDRAEICRACVETVAENCNDAVVAPLFWLAIGGPVGLWVFKAASTLDSMVGYRDDRYLRIGWASARLDDLACLVPARLTWLLVSTAAIASRERALGALRIGWRDGRKHPSPNAAWSEAAFAGALGVQLGGINVYRGVSSVKPFLGDSAGPIEPSTVRRAVRLMRTTSLLAALLAWWARCAWLGGA